MINRGWLYALGISISVVLLVILLWPEPIQTTEVGEVLANWMASLLSDNELGQADALVRLEFWLNLIIFIPFAFVLQTIIGRYGNWIAPVLSMTFSVVAEFIQKTLLVQRVASLQDVALNSAGAIVGWVLALLVSQLGRNRESSLKR